MQSDPSTSTRVAVALDARSRPESVHVFTVATSYKLGLHNLVAGLAHHGFGYSTLRFGEAWRGWVFRMETYRDAARAYSNAHGPKALIALCDAYDLLCVRDVDDGLVDTFRSFGKPIVFGLEAGCQILGNGNCGHIERYWLATQGAQPRRPNRFANGGFLMGEAHAIADAYAWMLEAGHTDDQIGLADFVSEHPHLCAADATSRIILNAYWLEGRSGRDDESSRRPWFIHFAGLKETPTAMGYAEAVRKHCGPFAIANNDTTNARWVYSLYIALAVLALVLVAASCGFALGSSTSTSSTLKRTPSK
jgi:hypothetical protein